VEDTLILIWQAQQAAEHGDKVTARNLLRQALHLDPNSGLAWEWMARLAAEPEQRRYCLERLLALEPKNPFGLEQQLREDYTPLPPTDTADQTREMTLQDEEIPAQVKEPEPEIQVSAVTEETDDRSQQAKTQKSGSIRQETAPVPSVTITRKKNTASDRLMSAIAWLIVLMMLAGVLAFMAYQYFPEWFFPGVDTSLVLPFTFMV
jgi:hypothetical protein